MTGYPAVNVMLTLHVAAQLPGFNTGLAKVTIQPA